MSEYPRVGDSWRNLGHTSMSITTASTSINNGGVYTIPAGSVIVRIQPEDGNIRWTGHGTVPTMTWGCLIASGDVERIGGVISDIKLVATSGTVVTNINFEGRPR